MIGLITTIHEVFIIRLSMDTDFFCSCLINFFSSRVMAAALSLTFGRGGALIGNLIFGFLIDLNCVVPIVLFASMLFGKYF